MNEITPRYVSINTQVLEELAKAMGLILDRLQDPEYSHTIHGSDVINDLKVHKGILLGLRESKEVTSPEAPDLTTTQDEHLPPLNSGLMLEVFNKYGSVGTFNKGDRVLYSSGIIGCTTPGTILKVDITEGAYLIILDHESDNPEAKPGPIITVYRDTKEFGMIVPLETAIHYQNKNEKKLEKGVDTPESSDIVANNETPEGPVNES